MKDYLLKSDPGTTFSGSAHHGGTKGKSRNNKKNGNKQPAQANPRTQARTPRWSPHGPTLLAATSEIQRMQAMLTAQAQSPYPDAQFGMPVSSHPATVFSASRPREFYTVGCMVLIIPTMDQHVKSWGQIQRTRTP